jgi:hypothetical protein
LYSNKLAYMSKRPGASSFGALLAKKAKTDQQTAADQVSQNQITSSKNRYLSTPVQPAKALSVFLTNARTAARNFLPKETKYPVTKPFCEIEARLGILKLPFGATDRRVTSSGPKHHNGVVVEAFHCHQQPGCVMESGVSRTHFVTWTHGGLVSRVERILFDGYFPFVSHRTLGFRHFITERSWANRSSPRSHGS